MQIDEVFNETLERAFKVSIPVSDLKGALAAKIEETRRKVRLKGFRPGHVPKMHIERLYGRALTGEVVEERVKAGCDSLVRDHGLKVSRAPRLTFAEGVDAIALVQGGEGDLTFTVAFDLVPDVPLCDLKSLKIERLTATVGDKALASRSQALGEHFRAFDDAPQAAKVKTGDRVTVTVEARREGKPFAPGSFKDTEIDIGGGGYVPGFEEALVGGTSGQVIDFSVTMPAGYHAREIAGKVIDLSAKIEKHKCPGAPLSRQSLVEKLGVKDEKALDERLREECAREIKSAVAERSKRAVLDALDAAHTFPLPEYLVEAEIQNVASQLGEAVEAPKEDEGADAETAGSEKVSSGAQEPSKEARRLAERRIRLGFVISEIATVHDIKVSQEETARAINAYVARFGAQSAAVVEHLRTNPEAVQSIVAPILERKVIDFVLELAEVTDREVEFEELMAPLDD